MDLGSGGGGSLRLTRPTLFQYVNGAGGERFTPEARAGVVWDLIRSGVFEFADGGAAAGKVLPFSEEGAREAHRTLENRETARGKLLLGVSPPLS